MASSLAAARQAQVSAAAEQRGQSMYGAGEWDFESPNPYETDRDAYFDAKANAPPVGQGGIPKAPGTGHASAAQAKPALLYPSPYRNGLEPPVNDSRNTSEPDSLLDLYGHRQSPGERRVDSQSPDVNAPGRQPPAGAQVQMEEGENSRWIHRDKLLQIERKEMQDAGITPPAEPHKYNKIKSPRDRQASVDPTEQTFDQEAEQRRPSISTKKRHLKSPAQISDGSPISGWYDTMDQEDVTAGTAESSVTTGSSHIPYNTTPRSASSRIPLPRSSPMPLPKDEIERSTLRPRKRSESIGGDADISYPYSHSRSTSVGSQNLLDHTTTPQSSNFAHQPGGSPTKSRSGSTRIANYKDTPPHQTGHTAKSRQGSLSARSPDTPSIRPKSRSGLEPRPPTGTINRPPGEPPWLKEMYAPDPRLPQDQQILPTHAKRLQQEQWEQAQRDSESRRREMAQQHATYEPPDDPPQAPNFSASSPLAVHTSQGLQAGPESTSLAQQQGLSYSDSKWPLGGNESIVTAPNNKAITGKASNPNLPSSPSRSTAAGAGYSTMPYIPPAPVRQYSTPLEHDKFQRMINPGTSISGIGEISAAVAATNEKPSSGRRRRSSGRATDEKGAGCRCCIVM